MKRWIVSPWVFVGAILLLVAVEPAFAVDNLRVAYPSMNTSVFALVIAQKEGYFKEEGLNVELLSIRGEIAIRTTLAGEVDFFTNAGSALAAAVRGVPVRLVTVFQDKPGWDLIAVPDIKSVAQLRGKNIGIMSPEGSLAVVAREILRKNGLDPTKDVNLVVMGGDEVRFPALQTKSYSSDAIQHGDEHPSAEGRLIKLGTASEYANLVEGGSVDLRGQDQAESGKNLSLCPRRVERAELLRQQAGIGDQIHDGWFAHEGPRVGELDL